MFTAFDVGVAVLVLISAILATARGFTREVLSLATWAGSAAIAAYMYFYHSDIAPGYIQEAAGRDRRHRHRQLPRRADRAPSAHHVDRRPRGRLARRSARPHARLRVRRRARHPDLRRRGGVRELPARRPATGCPNAARCQELPAADERRRLPDRPAAATISRSSSPTSSRSGGQNPDVRAERDRACGQPRRRRRRRSPRASPRPARKNRKAGA